jgi:hypothetical protein
MKYGAPASSTSRPTWFRNGCRQVVDASDLFAPVAPATKGIDGRVSIEVDPPPRLGHRRHHRRGQAPAQEGQQGQRPDQDPGNPRRPRGQHGHPGRGHQRQRDPDLLARALPCSHQRLPVRPGAGQGQRSRPRQDPLGRVLLRLPRGRRNRQAHRGHRHRRSEGTQGQGRTGQRTPGLPGLRGTVLHRTLGPAGRSLRAPPSVRCGPPPA